MRVYQEISCLGELVLPIFPEGHLIEMHQLHCIALTSETMLTS